MTDTLEERVRQLEENEERMETAIDEVRDNAVYRLEQRVEAVEKRLYLVTHSRGGTITTQEPGMGPDSQQLIEMMEKQRYRILELEDALDGMLEAEELYRRGSESHDEKVTQAKRVMARK